MAFIWVDLGRSGSDKLGCFSHSSAHARRMLLTLRLPQMRVRGHRVGVLLSVLSGPHCVVC